MATNIVLNAGTGRPGSRDGDREENEGGEPKTPEFRPKSPFGRKPRLSGDSPSGKDSDDATSQKSSNPFSKPSGGGGASMLSMLAAAKGNNEGLANASASKATEEKSTEPGLGIMSMMASKRLLKKRKEKAIAEKARYREELFDLVIYVIFMVFFAIRTTTGLYSMAPYEFTNNIEGTFYTHLFARIGDIGSLEAWLTDSLPGYLHSTNLQTEDWSPGATTVTATESTGWYMIGPARIAQIRSKSYDCTDQRPDVFTSSGNQKFTCIYNRGTPGGSHFHEEFELKREFRGFTYDNNLIDDVEFQRERPFTSYETPMRFVWPAPAYGVLVNPYANNISETTAQLQQLVDNSYIDEYTNVVFIDMTFYDYLVERQAWVRFSVEILKGGAVKCSHTIVNLQLYTPKEKVGYYWFLDTIIGGGYAFLGLMQLIKVKRIGWKAYKARFRSWIETANVGCYILQCAFQSITLAQQPMEVNIRSHKFIDFRPVIMGTRSTIAIQSCNAFLNWFKLVAYAGQFPRFALLMDTFVFAASPLFSFTFVFVIVLWGFAQAHSMLFGSSLKNYSTIEFSLYTLLRAMMGDFAFEELLGVNRYLGPLFFGLYIVLGSLIILNVIIAIIADAYLAAQAKQQEKMELLTRTGKSTIDTALIKEICGEVRDTILCKGGSKKIDPADSPPKDDKKSKKSKPAHDIQVQDMDPSPRIADEA